jgi:hypothetical protein
MNAPNLTLTTVVLFAALLIAPYSATTQPLWATNAASCELFGYSGLLTPQENKTDFDLGHCQWECRMKFGLEPMGPGGGGQSLKGFDEQPSANLHSDSYLSYSDCIADCNRAFWKEFDKKFERGGVKN